MVSAMSVLLEEFALDRSFAQFGLTTSETNNCTGEDRITKSRRRIELKTTDNFEEMSAVCEVAGSSESNRQHLYSR